MMRVAGRRSIATTRYVAAGRVGVAVARLARIAVIAAPAGEWQCDQRSRKRGYEQQSAFADRHTFASG